MKYIVYFQYQFYIYEQNIVGKIHLPFYTLLNSLMFFLALKSFSFNRFFFWSSLDSSKFFLIENFLDFLFQTISCKNRTINSHICLTRFPVVNNWPFLLYHSHSFSLCEPLPCTYIFSKPFESKLQILYFLKTFSCIINKFFYI